MSVWQAFVDGFRGGFTQGPTVLSIVRVALVRRDRELEVTFDMRVDNWNGNPVELAIEVVDCATQASVASLDYRIKPDWPCWNVTISNVTYKVTDVPVERRCYVRLTLREDGNVLAFWTSAPVEPSRSAADGASAGQTDRTQSRGRRARNVVGDSSTRTRRRARSSSPVASREEKLLGLVPGYDAVALKAAYRRALSRWHPDRFARSTQTRRDAATERTRRIIEAYAALVARLAASAR